MMQVKITKFGNATNLVYTYRCATYELFDSDGNYIGSFNSRYILNVIRWYRRLAHTNKLRFKSNCMQHDYLI